LVVRAGALVPHAPQEQKFFASFFQKRSASLFPCRHSIAAPGRLGQFQPAMALSRRFLIAAGACAPLAAEAANTKTPAPPPPGVLNAGVVLPDSGPNGLAGDECLRGIQLAARDINEAGGIAGRPLLLATSDAPSQAQADNAARSLIGGHAAFLLGSGVSTISYPASAAAELAQTPFLELTATADGITGRDFKFLLRCCETTSMVAGVAVAAIAARAPGKKLALLFNTGATGGAIAAAAVTALQARKIAPLLVIGYPEDVADLHEPVQRMARAGVEVLLHAGGNDDVLLLFQALQDGGWRPSAIFGCADGYLARENAYALGGALDGVFAIGAPFYPQRAAYLADAYQARFGMAPRSPDSLTAYVGAKLVFDVLNGAGGDATRLLDALRRTDLASGTLANGFGVAFDKTGQNTRSFAVLQQWRGQALGAV
jgi:branched-chain amino acid transport system substrate-binding protein